MKIKFLTNIPSPYRLDFFNELGKYVDLEVVFEATRNNELNDKWYTDDIRNFKATFLKEGNIEEKKINWSIIKNIKSHKQDFIIVTNYAYLTELIALIYIKIKKIPYIMEIDGGIIKGRENIFLKILKTFLIKGAKAYISPSKETDKFLISYGAKSENIFRYNFTSLKNKDILSKVLSEDEKNALKEKLGFENKKVILSVGRFVEIKGFDVLLNTAKEFTDEIHFVFIGGTPIVSYLKICEKYNLKNVSFIEFKEKEKLKEYYKMADLFVLPTKGDVWGLVINEAMAAGLPIITTNKCVAGLELVKDNGFIVEANNILEITQMINRILNDNNLRLFQCEKSLEIIRNYTIEQMGLDHEKVLKQVMREI